MENTTETTSTPAATSKAFHVWLWGVRLSAAVVIATFLLLLCQHVLGVLSLGPCDPNPRNALRLLLLLVPLLPNLLILWWVRTAAPVGEKFPGRSAVLETQIQMRVVKRIKRGLALAVPWGSLILILSAPWLKITMKVAGWEIWALLALTHTVLVASAIGEALQTVGVDCRAWGNVLGEKSD